MTPKEAVELGKKNNVKFIDLKFIDFPGIWQHTQIPAHRVNEALFEGQPRVRRLVAPRMAADQRPTW